MMGIDFGTATGVAGAIGLVVYLIACVIRRVLPPIDKTLEAIGSVQKWHSTRISVQRAFRSRGGLPLAPRMRYGLVISRSSRRRSTSEPCRSLSRAARAR
jgi:hypothetical protein